MEDAPGVLNGRVGGDYAVREGEGDHVEVTEGDNEAVAPGGSAHEFGDFPGLCGAVANIGVVGFLFVGGV